MNLKTLSGNWKAALSSSVMLSGAVAGLVAVCVMQQAKINSLHERLVLVPPMMTKETIIGWNEASQSLFENWGVYYAKMLGSATPNTARFVADRLDAAFDSKELYQTVRTQLLSIEKDPSYARSGSLNEFSPRAVAWEASTSTIYVSGYLKTTAYRTSLQTLANVYITYQITMKMVDGNPKIGFITSYAGQPRTLKYLEQHPADADRIQKDQQAKAGLIAPEESDIQRAIESGEGGDGPDAPAGEEKSGKKAAPAGKPAVTADQEPAENDNQAGGHAPKVKTSNVVGPHPVTQRADASGQEGL